LSATKSAVVCYLAAFRAAMISSIFSSVVYLKSQVFRARASSCSALLSNSTSSFVTTEAPFFWRMSSRLSIFLFHFAGGQMTTFIPRSASCLATPTRPTLALRDPPQLKAETTSLLFRIACR
jgi:hypothetical protein